MKKCIVIYFTGIDGSGKSTLSKYLLKELKIKGYKVKYIWWLEVENSLLRRLLRKIGRQNFNTINNKKIKHKKIH
jgi:thymidylate kinase